MAGVASSEDLAGREDSFTAVLRGCSEELAEGRGEDLGKELEDEV